MLISFKINYSNPNKQLFKKRSTRSDKPASFLSVYLKEQIYLSHYSILMYFHILPSKESLFGYQYILVCILLRLERMKIQKRSQAATPLLPQVNRVFDQQYQTSDMQNTFFNKENNIQNNNKLLQFQLSQKQTPIIPPLEEDEYSNNVLNIGFIAEDSKFCISDSQSVASDGFSISAVSAIRANPKGSPHFINCFDEEISGFSHMEQWSQNSQISFTNKNFKRNKPEAIEDECEQMQNQFTKKKMNQRNKVVTLSQSVKGMKQSGYMLRSKSKQLVVEEQSSSNEDIREILVNMEKTQKGGNLSKNKITQK